MAERLPIVSGLEARAAFERGGFEFRRQQGSHMIMRQIEQPHARIVIPNHKEIAKGTLRRIIRDAGLTVEEFAELLRK